MSDAFIACPWCGDVPKGLNYRAQDGMKWAAGHCPHCEASTPPVRTNYKFEGRQPWMDEADAEWNRRASGWIKVSDAPIPGYETVLMGLWVYNKRTDKKHFEQYILQYDPELGELWDGDNSFSDWNISDFEFWMPLPSAPEVEE